VRLRFSVKCRAPGSGPVGLVGAIGELLGGGVVGAAVEGQRVAGAVAREAEREGTFILADPDAGMNVEARLGPLEHRLGLAIQSPGCAMVRPSQPPYGSDPSTISTLVSGNGRRAVSPSALLRQASTRSPVGRMGVSSPPTEFASASEIAHTVSTVARGVHGDHPRRLASDQG